MRATSVLQNTTSRQDRTLHNDIAGNINNYNPNTSTNFKTEYLRGNPSFLVSSINPSNSQDIPPSTKALLEPNTNYFNYLFPHRALNLSPYEVNENPFTEIRPYQILQSRTTCPSPRNPYKPKSLDKKYRGNVENRMNTEKIISIDNFDPNVKTQFNEIYTIKAIKRLGIQQTDLFFPTSEELDKIGGDRLYFKDLLTERALKYAEDVRVERNKILMDDLLPSEMTMKRNVNFPMVNIHRRSKSENQGPLLQSNIGVSPSPVTAATTSILPSQQQSSNNITSNVSSNSPFSSPSHPTSNPTSRLQTQRLTETATTSRLKRAIERASLIEEQQMQEKRKMIEKNDKRHDKILREMEIDRRNKLLKQQEKNENRKLRSQLFNQKQRASQIQKLEELENAGRQSKRNSPPQHAVSSQAPAPLAQIFDNKANIASPSKNPPRPRLLSHTGSPPNNLELLINPTFSSGAPDQFHVT
ncbi:hypothetical protein TRFO_27563 [Tritrichomonas foetus]|uniref:Uncharacterized protein n=1 Tax=Tritrichomonas foetus TaxID=1144522 RepID=A0A1J4K592_9EUKA|nr:hypothetical protein TRFO_27563 [Tritrichomonas foetus]|eukprot:OHT04884.1 hypothetical protein TRFO_27563 [Tritrichomonas foetus]